jgi:hypothetical protein
MEHFANMFKDHAVSDLCEHFPETFHHMVRKPLRLRQCRGATLPNPAVADAVKSPARDSAKSTFFLRAFPLPQLIMSAKVRRRHTEEIYGVLLVLVCRIEGSAAEYWVKVFEFSLL